MPVFSFFSKIFAKKGNVFSSVLQEQDLVNKALFYELLDANDSIILFFTRESGYIGANATFYKIFGLKSIDNFREQHESIRELFIHESEEIFTEDDKSWMDYIRLHKKGTHFVKIKSLEGEVLQFSVYNSVLKEAHRDIYILELKNVTELESAKAKANEIEALKTKILSNIGHEFRTPMNSILGFLDLLEKSGLTPTQSDYLKMTSSAARSLMSNIEALLDLSQLQSGRLSVLKSEFDLIEELNDLIDFFVEEGLRQQINVGFFVDPKLPKKLEGDIHKIRQIISSLVQNAVKFTAAGGKVLVEIKLLKINNKGDCSIGFSIKDNGKGIPPNRLAEITQPFIASDQPDQRLGVGLSLSYALVSLMGSELKIQSEEHRGSIFSFALEFHNSKGHSFEMISNKNVKVLLVDEVGIDDANLLTTYLRSFGIGAEKVNIIDQEIFDNISALYVVASNKNTSWRETLGKLVKKAPVVLLQESVEPLDKNLFEFADVILNKPLTPSMIFSHLNKLFAQPYEVQENSKKSHRGTLALVVEDNLINQRLIKILLQEYNIDVVTASNGQEAVDICDQKDFDMVFMDIDMPIKNGVIATNEIKSHFVKNGHTMPIIAVTALAMEGDRERLLESGLDDYLSKPLTRNKLELILNKYLQR